MSVVERYWQGVLQRLQAEVDVFSRLVQHAGERGRANEIALSTLLEAFVPRRFGVGTGLVIDSEDRYSRQTDIVIFEQTDEPVVLAQATHLLHPVETVLGCVEVKTTLRSGDVDDCIDKKEAMLSLKPATTHADGSDHPAFILLAYQTGMSPEAIRGRLIEADPRLRPDLLCVVNYPLVGGDLLLDAPNGEFPLGLVLLHKPMNGEEGYEEASVGATEMLEVRGQITYPVVDHGDRRFVADPARALLLFTEALARKLATMRGRDAPVISSYLTPRARGLLWIT